MKAIYITEIINASNRTVWGVGLKTDKSMAKKISFLIPVLTENRYVYKK
jgi:hypothetical protein